MFFFCKEQLIWFEMQRHVLVYTLWLHIAMPTWCIPETTLGSSLINTNVIIVDINMLPFIRKNPEQLSSVAP
jgi:hypothetical protein